MSWFGWQSSPSNPLYEELVEKATSPLNLPYPESEDIALNLEICDLIRSKQVQPRAAMLSLKQRIGSKNGRVQMSALGLVDTCIKNGGDHFLAEIAGKDFTDELVGVIKGPSTQPQVRELTLKFFQNWALAFESKPSLSYLPSIYRELKSTPGIHFPPPPSAIPSHMLTTATPPTWVDSDSCMRCRTPFSFTNRKHHCRNCGCVYDQACSSKNMPLPRLGIMQPVRVCEGCWAKSGKESHLSSKVDPNTPPVPSKRTPRRKADFDADLQRAIALSLAEAQPGRSGSGPGHVPSQPGRKLEGTDEVDEEDEQLRLAIEASLAEMEKVKPTAPGEPEVEPEYKPLPTYDLTPTEVGTMLTFTQTIDHAVGFGDRDLRRFPHAHALHDQARHLSSKLARNIDEKSTKYQMLSEMQDRLMQVVRRYDSLLTEQDTYSRQQQEARRQQQAYPYSSYANSPYGMYGYNSPMAGQAGPSAGPAGYGQPGHVPPQAYYAPPPEHMARAGAPTAEYASGAYQPYRDPSIQSYPAQYGVASTQQQQYSQAAPTAAYSGPEAPQQHPGISTRQDSTITNGQAGYSQSHNVQSQQTQVYREQQSPPAQIYPTAENPHPSVYPTAPAGPTSPVAAKRQLSPVATTSNLEPTYAGAPTSPGAAATPQPYPSYAAPQQAPQVQQQNHYVTPSALPTFPDAPTSRLPQQMVPKEEPKEALLIEL